MAPSTLGCPPSPSLATPGRSGCDALRSDRCPVVIIIKVIYCLPYYALERPGIKNGIKINLMAIKVDVKIMRLHRSWILF